MNHRFNAEYPGDPSYEDHIRKAASEKDIQAAVMYLSHCKKDDHVLTVQRLMDQIARLESYNSALREQLNPKHEVRMDDYMRMQEPMPMKRSIDIPEGTRKVSIEL